MTSSTDACLLLHPNEIGSIDRGAGVKTTPLVGKWNCEHNAVTTGITTFESGKGIPLHYHNVEETVMVLEGVATVIMGDDSFEAKAGGAGRRAPQLHKRRCGRDAHLLGLWRPRSHTHGCRYRRDLRASLRSGPASRDGRKRSLAAVQVA